MVHVHVKHIRCNHLFVSYTPAGWEMIDHDERGYIYLQRHKFVVTGWGLAKCVDNRNQVEACYRRCDANMIKGLRANNNTRVNGNESTKATLSAQTYIT